MAAQAGLCLAWSETPEDTFCRVVAHLDMFFEYSERTKIMVFVKRCDQHFNFQLTGHQIATCTNFRRVDAIVSRNRHFYQARKHNVEQAKEQKHVYILREIN